MFRPSRCATGRKFMRISDLLIGLAVFGFWSTASIAANDGEIHTAAPPRPLLAPGANDARDAAVQQSGYDARLRMYASGRAIPLAVRPSSDAASVETERAPRATNRNWAMRGHD